MPTADQLVRGQAVRIAQVRRAVTGTVSRSWSSLADYRDEAIAGWARRTASTVQAGQVRTASLVDAYMAAYKAEVIGSAVGPVGIPLDVATGARGVPAAEVYGRMGPEVWSSLSRGLSFDEAVRAGLARALKTAETDLQLAKTHSSRYLIDNDTDAVSYRRVLNGESCTLCSQAATRVYHRGDLMPIHPGCDCGVRPVYEDHPTPTPDPGTPVDDRGDVEVNHHSELGPVLTVHGQHFEGPN